jgi:hypothetical protein
MSESKLDSPKRISKPQLAAVGLVLVSSSPLVVQCATCGAEWQPLRLLGTRWWRCHNGCNKAT